MVIKGLLKFVSEGRNIVLVLHLLVGFYYFSLSEITPVCK